MDYRTRWYGLAILTLLLVGAVAFVWVVKPYFTSTSPAPATAEPVVTEPFVTEPATDILKDTAAVKEQTTCVMTGKPIDKKLYVDAEGYRIYVCCPGCLDGVKKDPKAAIEKIRTRGEEPLKLTAVDAPIALPAEYMEGYGVDLGIDYDYDYNYDEVRPEIATEDEPEIEAEEEIVDEAEPELEPAEDLDTGVEEEYTD